MSTSNSRSDTGGTPDPLAGMREGLDEELALYRQLDRLADESLALLTGGDGGRAFLDVLERKRHVLDEVRKVQEVARAKREAFRRRSTRTTNGFLAEFEAITAAMEDVLRQTIRKEEEVDLRLRANGFHRSAAYVAARPDWFAAPEPAAAPPESARLARVG